MLPDAAGVAAVYAPEVLTGTASFETEAPAASGMAARMAKVIDAGWPWLVAETGGVITGFAYASQFRDRPAYRHTCENSVYVAAAARGTGTGRALMAALADAARAAGFLQMIAAIGDSGNTASIRLHAACGFAPAGQLSNVGLKFGRWLDVVYMQRSL